MVSNFVSTGDRMMWVNDTGGAVAAGDVVVAFDLLGVALADIAAGDRGEIATSGVWRCPKLPTAHFRQGEQVVWNPAAAAFDDVEAAVDGANRWRAAVAWAPAEKGATVAEIKINVAPAMLRG